MLKYLKKALIDIEILPDKVKIPENNILIIDPEGLGKADDDAFVTVGLPHLISELSEQIQEHEEKYEVILVPTGGYKSIIPYATLAGILHKKEIKYIYEESDKLMTLPPIPVGLDLEQWKPAYVKLKALTTQPSKNMEVYYNSLDDAFKNLLEPPPNEDMPYKFSAMGEFLKGQYLHLRYRVPIQLQTAGTSLLKYLKRDPGKPDLQEFFSQLVKIGPHLWLGDKVPEMAEHALHHHTNLFEIAEIMLLPILEKKNNFLSAEELFVLLCTIYFHDWGHVISELDGKPLLPRQIRDFHHILGYERLKKHEWQEKLIELGLHWVGNETQKANELWERYLKLIAIIGLFHRKKMPLKGTECLFSCDNVPGKDSDRLLRFLMSDPDINWAENAEIRKSDDDKTIRIFKDKKSAEIMIHEDKEKAILKISDGKTHDLKVRKENGKLNIYERDFYPCPVNKKEYVALEKQANNQSDEDNGRGWFLQFEGKSFLTERAILIASLFRIIDSLDNQLARMGTPEEIRMKAAVVRNDADNEKHRQQEIEKMLTQYLENKSCEDLKQSIDNLIEGIIGSYQARESTGATGKVRFKSEELELEGEIDKLASGKFNASESTFAKSLIRFYIDASCWAFFKKEQPKHYLRHLIMKTPIISYQNSTMEHTVTVEFRKEEEAKLKEYCKAFDINPDTDLPDVNEIIGNIKEEYAKVESILNEKGLNIIYQN